MLCMQGALASFFSARTDVFYRKDMHISIVEKSEHKTIPLSRTNPSLKKSIEAPPGFDTSDAFVSNGSTREGAMHTDA